MVQHATKLNEAFAAVRGVPLSRAHITYGGYYETLWFESTMKLIGYATTGQQCDTIFYCGSSYHILIVIVNKIMRMVFCKLSYGLGDSSIIY